MKKGKVNILIDGQWGSTGKGKIAGYLATKEDIDVAAATTSPNAGHTWICGDRKLVLKQLPTSAINEDAAVFISAQSVIDPARLLQEAEEVGCTRRLYIHPHAAVVTDRHKEIERSNLNRISSTLQGTAAALTSRAMREPDAVAKNNPSLKAFTKNSENLLQSVLRAGGTVFLEMSQGFDLSLTLGYDYPYVTSREVTTCSGLDSLGVGPRDLGEVIGSIRANPIRVGHAFKDNDPTKEKLGDSGPFYSDQQELTWEQVTKLSGCTSPLSETTTVTGKVRRVFTFSRLQIRKFVRVCEPSVLFVNHINYVNFEDFGKSKAQSLTEKSKQWIDDLQLDLDHYCSGIGKAPPIIKYVGTGPDDHSMIEL